MNTIQLKKALNSKLLSKSALLIGLIIMLICFFLPYATATENNREYYEEYPDSMFIDELEMTNADAVNISLFEYFKIYKHIYNVETNDSKVIAIICIVLISAAFILTLISLLFTFLKKPIAIIIFNLLNIGVFYANAWDHLDRNVIENNNYNFGIGYYIYYIAAAIVFAGAICMLISKLKEKKLRLSEQAESL